MSEPTRAVTELSGTARVCQCERIACREIDGKAVVITIDQNQLHVLNGVGTRVWGLCDGRSLSAIVDVIVQEFEVERTRATRDVGEFAKRLVAVGAARLVEPRD